MTPAYHKNESENLHPGEHKHRFQYDKTPDGHFWVWVGTWNIGSLSGKGEVYEELRKRMTGVCVVCRR